MLVGLTYDLRDEYLSRGYSEDETAELDRPDTIDAIEQALKKLGCRTDRIGSVHSLVQRLAAGGRWDLVFNIAEGLHGAGREAQVPCLLDAYRIPYTFSDPVVLGITLDKAVAKHVLRSLGIPTPDFAVVRSLADLDAVALPYPLFAKPLAEGTGKGITPESKIKDRAALRRRCAELLERYRQPVLVETFLPGRELTVGVIGSGAEAWAVAALEVELLGNAEPEVYSYHNKEHCEELVRYSLAADAGAREACELALAAWRGLGCRDGGRVDLRAGGDGHFQVLELNPLAGIHPEHSDLPILWTKTGRSYLELIRAIVDSALRRLPAPAGTSSRS